MDSFMFAFLVLLSTADFLLIPGGIMLAGYEYLQKNTMLAGVGIGMAIFGFVMLTPLKRIKLKYKERAQTDEDGRLKGTKFNELSNAERQAIAKQRTAMLENIVSTSELNKKTKKGSESPEADMNKLVGLESVKQEMREMVARMEFDRKDKNLKGSAMSGRHMVFYGSPGTGKAQPLYSKVLTPSGFVTMGSLKIGDTVVAGSGKYAKIIGVYPQGVKPIYEVTLSDGSKCRCSDEHLWTVMRNGREETLELKEMLDCYMKDGHPVFSIMPADISIEEKIQDDDPFVSGLSAGQTGNAHVCENRLGGTRRSRRAFLSGLMQSASFSGGIMHTDSESEETFCALVRSVGASPMKTEDGFSIMFDSLLFGKSITDISYVGEETCQCIYIDDPSHLYITDDYIVTHNTTVARIITGFLYKNGYIKKNQLIEIDGNFLKAGEYTAVKTEEIIRRARGGVLFIDEAYALMQSSDGSGQEAIATLIKQMEDMRSDFILIMAGYTREMQALLRMNPGFSSRIKEYLDFPDYDDKSMREIFTMMAKGDGFTVEPEAYKAFDNRVVKERRTMSFGNGRTARNILDEARNRHALNFIQKHLPESQRYVISYDDIPQDLKRSSGF